MRSRNLFILSFLGLQAILAAAGDSDTYPTDQCGLYLCLTKYDAGAANFTISIPDPQSGAKFCLEDPNTRSNDANTPDVAVVRPCAPADDQGGNPNTQMWETFGSGYRKWMPEAQRKYWPLDIFAYKGYLKNVGTGRCLAPVAYPKEERPGDFGQSGFQVYGRNEMVDCNDTSSKDPELQFRNDYMAGTDIQILYPKSARGYPADEFEVIDNGLGDYYNLPKCPESGRLSILIPFEHLPSINGNKVAEWGCINVNGPDKTPEDKRRLLAQADNGPVRRIADDYDRTALERFPELCSERLNAARDRYEVEIGLYNADQKKYQDNCECREIRPNPIIGLQTRCLPEYIIFTSTKTVDLPHPAYTEFTCTSLLPDETPWSTPEARPAQTSCPFEYLARTPEITPPP